MPKYEKFEDLLVWQEGARLSSNGLDLLEEPNVPLTPGFRNQLDRPLFPYPTTSLKASSA